MSGWFQTRALLTAGTVALAAGIGIGWVASDRVRDNDACAFARDSYEIVSDPVFWGYHVNPYDLRFLNDEGEIDWALIVTEGGYRPAPDGDRFEYDALEERYGERAANAIMTEKYEGTRSTATIMAAAVIDACGEAPSSD